MGDEEEGEKAPHERDGGLPFTMEFNYTGAAFLRQFEVLRSSHTPEYCFKTSRRVLEARGLIS